MAWRLTSWFGLFAARPKLVLAALLGMAVGLAAWRLAGLLPVSSALLGWDTLCLAYIGGALWSMSRSSTDDMRARAARDDQSRPVILSLVVVAAVAAVGAIALELSLARTAHGLERGLRVALAFATVAASWFTVHLVFALHYAHAYYDQAADGRGDTGGLRFPGEKDEAPDYWDFLHFAVIIGVASQTADVAITSRPLRRLNTAHAIFAFAFNTVIVALTINLLAGLFG